MHARRGAESVNRSRPQEGMARASHRRRAVWLLLAGMASASAIVFYSQRVPAAPPWPIAFSKVDSQPQELYPIAETNGPWMILAATFTGEGSETQARKLIHELRADHRLLAFSYQKKFDYSQGVQGKGITPSGEPRMMKYRNSTDVTEIAVLVGNYTSVDDAEAQKTLKKLKDLHPKAMVNPLAAPSVSTAEARAASQKKRGPLSGAFVMTNPLLPPEYFVPKGLDNFVIELNKPFEHSLLKCNKPYTVRVATFTGHAILLDSRNARAIQDGVKPKSYLESAGNHAHILCESLRKKGYEAYEFHDRSASIVTVGSFDRVTFTRPDGSTDFDPTVQKIMKTFGPHDAQSAKDAGNAKLIGKPKQVHDLPLDPRPWPVEVPQRNISTDYVRAPIGR